MTRDRYDSEEEDDDEEDYRRPLNRRRFDSEPHPGRQLLHLMRALDEARRKSTAAANAIQEHLERHEDLKVMFADFTARGGSTAEDLSAWLVDDHWRRKDLVLRKKHLMLLEGSGEDAKKKKLLNNRPRLRRRRDDEPRGAA